MEKGGKMSCFKLKQAAETEGLTSGKTGYTTHESRKLKGNYDDATEIMIKSWIR